MISVKRKTWVIIAFWAFLFIMYFNMVNYFQPTKYALIAAAFNTLTIVIMYYVTVWYLFPRFYHQGKMFFIISLSMVVVLGIIFCIIDQNLMPEFHKFDHEKPPVQFHFSRFIISMAFTFFVGTSLSLMEQATQMKENEKLLTKEKLETELKLLKAQINPHFIFNALNNIYSLTYMKSPNAPDSVLKLSEMLRYVFYDCSKDRVPLSAELNYIENFNSFQKMKSEFSQNISFTKTIESGNTEIAPMLFIPFIENAYKYSRIEENEDAFVNIRINSTTDEIVFLVENSIPKTSKSQAGSGMGIKNVEQRLTILYPEKSDLKIEEKKDVFTVELIIHA